MAGLGRLGVSAHCELAVPFADAVAADMGTRIEWAEVRRGVLHMTSASDDAATGGGFGGGRGSGDAAGGGGAADAGTVEIVTAVKTSTLNQRVIVVPLPSHRPVSLAWLRSVCVAGYRQGVERVVLAAADEDSTVCYYQARMGMPSATEVNDATTALLAARWDEGSDAEAREPRDTGGRSRPRNA
mmetsp:Transcript_4960/g.17962  ORF Transcript_4960/g.17962 Transcript_4960/m.17962 type:complete len:185 (+) Transcript_4960:155-709(+)